MEGLECGWKVEHTHATLENSRIKVLVNIEDGGRIISIYDKKQVQEMIWTNDYTKTIRRHYGDNYDNTSNGGIEEAFPTVLPCSFEEKEFPFFGEIWNEPWEASMEGEDVLCLKRVSPLVHTAVEKRIYLEKEHRLAVEYRLVNLAKEEISYIFGVHPSLIIQEGDEIFRPEAKELVEYRYPLEIEVCQELLEKVPVADAGICYNLVQYPVHEGTYGVFHPKTNSGIKVTFEKEFFPALSLWFIYGGWRGLYCLMSEFFTCYPAKLSQAKELGIANHLTGSYETKVTYELLLRPECS